MGVLADGWRDAVFERSWGGYEEIEFYGGQIELFGVRHMPAPDVGERSTPAGVVVCSPTGSDRAINSEREHRLARRLAPAGMVVQSFCYRGSGDSQGNPGSLSFGSMVHDVRTTLQHLRDRCGVERVGLVGTRVGALVAARVARELPVESPLVLWQPVVDPRRYLADAVAVANAQERDLLATHPAGPVRRLVDSRLGRDLFSPGVVDNLVDILGVQPRPILLVQLHRRVGLAPDYRDAVGRWHARGFEVDVAYDPTEDDWWSVHENRQPSDDALLATTEWLAQRLKQ